MCYMILRRILRIKEVPCYCKGPPENTGRSQRIIDNNYRRIASSKTFIASDLVLAATSM